MGLLQKGVMSPGALALGTWWLSPPDRHPPVPNRYKQMATVITCNSYAAVLIFWLEHNPPLPPLLSLQAPCAHADHHYSSLPGRRCRSGG